MTSDGTRILFATGWYPAFELPGRASFVADQAAALVRSGLDVDVASWDTAIRYGTYRGVDTSDGSASVAPGAWSDAIRAQARSASPRSWGAPGVGVVRLPAVMPRTAGVPPDVALAPPGIAEALLAWSDNPRFARPAIVHAHVGVPAGIAAITLADRLGVPLVTTEHDSTTAAQLARPDLRDAYRRLVTDGRLLIAVSDTLRGRLAAALEIDPTRIDVVPNVVDVDAFPAPLHDAPRDAGELLWVGGRSAAKGTDVLLEAFARLGVARPGLRLRLIGRATSEAEEQRLLALARDLGIADAVAFEGQGSRESVAGAMARATAFVHPSRFETFGVVAAEALASGLPVAATPSGGVEEIVGRDGRFGEIADDQGAEALAAAMTRVLDDRARFDPRAMREHVVTRYGPDAVAAQLRERYAALLERQARPAIRSTPGHGGLPATGEAAPATDDGRPVVLVVGIRRDVAAKRLARVPGDLARSLVVVTATGRGTDQPALADGPRWIELDPDRAYREALARHPAAAGRGIGARVVRLVRHPLRPIRLRRLRARRPSLVIESLRADVAVLVTGLGSPGPVEMVALTADDVDLVSPLLGDRLRLSPTTLQGVVDAWDASPTRR